MHPAHADCAVQLLLRLGHGKERRKRAAREATAELGCGTLLVGRRRVAACVEKLDAEQLDRHRLGRATVRRDHVLESRQHRVIDRQAVRGRDTRDIT